MFHIKICGITEPGDARMAVDAGADAIGLNFYRPSPRFVELEQAKEIVEVVGSQVAKVGLFVNESVENMVDAVDSLGLDYIQLHGDEPVELLEELGGRPVLRAFRSKGEDISEILVYLDRCRQKGCSPQAVLIDAHQPGLYGGTGKTVDWEMLAGGWDSSRPERLLLAGGLNPQNVAEAINMVRPWGVDVSSGVESQPGRKDPELVRGFEQQAAESLKTVGGDR